MESVHFGIELCSFNEYKTSSCEGGGVAARVFDSYISKLNLAKLTQLSDAGLGYFCRDIQLYERHLFRLEESGRRHGYNAVKEKCKR